jgi:hypothetical protein
MPTSERVPPRVRAVRRKAASVAVLPTAEAQPDPAGSRVCDVCGNEYDRAFQVVMGNRTWTFDSFECAIHACAPTCAHCGCRIIGHGVQTGSTIYCCARCARREGQGGVRDRV